MTVPKVKDDIQIAFEQLESTFITYKNAKAYQSNAHPLGSPHRVEANLSEIEKAHLAVLQSKLKAAIAQQQLRAQDEAANSSDRLGKKVLWLNWVVAALTAVMAVSAVWELVYGKA